MQETIGAIRTFLRENFLLDEASAILDDTSFMKQHILDSTGFIELVMFVEETFDLQVLDEEMLPENFDTLAGIARYVEGKRSARAA